MSFAQAGSPLNWMELTGTLVPDFVVVSNVSTGLGSIAALWVACCELAGVAWAVAVAKMAKRTSDILMNCFISN